MTEAQYEQCTQAIDKNEHARSVCRRIGVEIGRRDPYEAHNKGKRQCRKCKEYVNGFGCSICKFCIQCTKIDKDHRCRVRIRVLG